MLIRKIWYIDLVCGKIYQTRIGRFQLFDISSTFC